MNLAFIRRVQYYIDVGIRRSPASVINADNKMITVGVIGWIIWIYQII